MNLNTHAGSTLRLFLSNRCNWPMFPLFAIVNDDGAVVDWSTRVLHMRAVLDVERDNGNSGSIVVISDHGDLAPGAMPHTIQ